MDTMNEDAGLEAVGLYQNLPELSDDESAELAILLLDEIALTPSQRRRLSRLVEEAEGA